MNRQATNQRGNIWVWVLIVVFVAAVAGGVWWYLRGVKTAPTTGRGETAETALPTLSVSDKTTDIEAELNASTVTADDALFSEIEKELQGF